MPHVPRPALLVVPPEPVPGADRRVAGEYEEVLQGLVAAALRPGQPDARAGLAVGQGDPAVAREPVVAGE